MKSIVALFAVLSATGFSFASPGRPSEPPLLEIVNAGVSSSEDAPYVQREHEFLPGDFLYFTFQISGFGVQSENRGEVRKISLQYESTIQDSQGRPLVAPSSGGIQADLNPEDKDWLPKRRASFLIPSFVAAGQYRLHVVAKDLIAKTEASHDFPFLIGGVHLEPATSVTVDNFRFLRNEDDRAALTVPAYSPGDTVFGRFEMTGYSQDSGNHYHVAYGIIVLAPDGKPFIKKEEAADLESKSFYPAQFVPGDFALTIPKDSPRGSYIAVLTVRDALTNKSYQTKQVFSVE